MNLLQLCGLIFLGLFLLYWLGVAVVAAFVWCMGVVPYLIFFMTPFVVLSFLLGVTWAFGCGFLSSRLRPWIGVYRSAFDYRVLGLLIPVCVLITLVTVQIPMEHKVIVKGRTREIVIQMPLVFEYFKEFRGWWGSLIPSLMKKALLQGHAALFNSFDRNDLSVSVWSALLVGAPLVFWFISKLHQAEELWEQRNYEDNLVSRERNQHEVKIAQVESQLKKMHGHALWFQEALKREEAKVISLEARFEHAAPQMPGLPVKLEKDDIQKSGILESDLF